MEEAKRDDFLMDHYNGIIEREKSVFDAKTQWEMLKEKASSAKKIYESRLEDLIEFIDAGPDPQMKLRFGDSEPEDDDQSTDENSWRDVQVADAIGDHVRESHLKKLEDAGINTMGDLEDLRAGDGLGSIKGFGTAAVTMIEDAIITWLADFHKQREESSEEEKGDVDQEKDEPAEEIEFPCSYCNEMTPESELQDCKECGEKELCLYCVDPGIHDCKGNGSA